MVRSSTNWRMVYLMGICALIQNSQYSVYQASLFSYMKKLDNSSTESQFGWIMATASLGQCVGCIILGWWNGRTNKNVAPIYCGFFLMFASNFVYLLLDLIPTHFVANFIMLSRFLGGLGMGNASPIRSCSSIYSTQNDRSKAMASISGGRSVGAVVGPGLHLLFLALGETGFMIIPGILFLHSNNAPAFFGIGLTIIGLTLLTVLFKNATAEEPNTKTTNDFENQCNTINVVYPSSDGIAMLVCMMTRFAQNFMQTSIDTLAPAILMMMYFQTRQEAVASMATTYLVTGLIATVLYLAIIFTKLSTLICDKMFNKLVLVLFMCHLVAIYSWEFYSEYVSDFKFSNETSTGCDAVQFTWCYDLTISPQWTFYVGYVLSFGLFLPFLTVANATLYSKLMNPDNRGALQSLFDISGTISRIIAPVFIISVYSTYGPRKVWQFICLLLLFTTFLWIIFDKRLVPIKPIQTQTFDNDAFAEDKVSQTKLAL